MEHPATRNMDITQNFKINSFLGVPIFLNNGELFGNLCCFDKNKYSFSDADVQLLQTMSTFFTYVIELENNKNLAEYDFERLYKENQLILDSLSEGVFGLDLVGNITFCNPSTLKLVDYSEKELLGVSPFTTFLRGTAKEHTDMFSTIKDGKSRTQYDEFFLRQNGDQFPVEYTANAIVENENIVGVVVTFKDVTEQKKSEELMLKSEKLNLAGQLAAGISHEIRNPLTAIKGFFQLIKVSDKKDEYFNIIDSELSRIEEISSELLMLAKPQTKTHSERNLVDIIHEVKVLLETQAIMKSIEIKTVFKESYLGIVCDKTKIKQVFINLVKNAIEIMDKGAITIKITTMHGQAIITVEDTGPGIPKERLHRIGEPFYSTKEKGTGLGLLTSYKIIENHKGEITVNSTVGKGTTFTIKLPINQQPSSII